MKLTLPPDRADKATAEKCLSVMERYFRVVSEIWEVRLGALDSHAVVTVREANRETGRLVRSRPAT